MKIIYDFITEEKVNYNKSIQLEDGWDWNMKQHLRRSFLYLNSQFEKNNENRDLRPNKNIILPILNIQYRTEGFDIKDIELYVDNPDEYYKSFLIKKFHNKWALENAIDTFIDDLVETYCTYGGVLVKNIDESRPEVIDLRSIAFCNQTNILDYPFAIKHIFSFSQLRKIKKWGKNENGATIDIESFIDLISKENKKEIELFEVHGLMPIEWLNDNTDNSEETEKDVSQIQVVGFYTKEDGHEQGVTLFKHREPELPFKFLSRDKVSNRALGRGGVEELFEPQVWTNWNEIKITEMLEAASKTINLTDNPTVAAKHPTGLKNLDNLEIIEVQPNSKGIWQLDTYPRNLNVFSNALIKWQDQAQKLGAASEGLLGEEPSSGTPFKLYEAQNIEARGMHKYRQGKIAAFMDEIYRDWILKHIVKEIAKNQIFLSELSTDEMQEISEAISKNRTNKLVVKKILSGEIVSKENIDAYRELQKQEFLKGKNKRFIEIIKDEMKNISLSVMTNIAGKQKNLALLTDKLVNVMRQFIATPQIRQDPEMVKLLNVILESSGLSPITFGTSPLMMPPHQGTTEPLKELIKQPTPALT